MATRPTTTSRVMNNIGLVDALVDEGRNEPR
jgi:hypothetical protein